MHHGPKRCRAWHGGRYAFVTEGAIADPVVSVPLPNPRQNKDFQELLASAAG